MSSTRTRKKTSVGQVSFVGAGPGDEGLLTLRAVERLAEASTVVVDQTGRERLVAARCPRRTSRSSTPGSARTASR